MNGVTAKALLAIGIMAVSATSSGVPVPVVLLQDRLRSDSGITYSLIFDGSDGSPLPTATWYWDAASGILAQSGFLQANQWIGSVPGPSASLILSDRVTGLTINTNTGTTTATTYNCLEGGAGAGTGRHSCGNIAFGSNAVFESTITYNVGGAANCQTFTIGGDDSGGVPQRGLRSWNGTPGCADNSGRGALDMVNVIVDDTAVGGILMLGNANGAVALSCYTAPAIPNPACNRAHWLIFSPYAEGPVPPAVWLFGSALVVLGWLRRKARLFRT